MAGYIGQQKGETLPDGSWVFTGYDLLYRIGDPECPWDDKDLVPKWFTVFMTSFDEPLSAVAWDKNKGLYVKPMSERGYDIKQCPFYPLLLSHFYNRDPVVGTMIKTLVEATNIYPSPERYLEFEKALGGTVETGSTGNTQGPSGTDSPSVTNTSSATGTTGAS